MVLSLMNVGLLSQNSILHLCQNVLFSPHFGVVFELGDGVGFFTSGQVASQYEGDTWDCSIPTQ